MRIVQPLTRTFRRQLRLDSIIYPARNWTLRRIAYLYDRFQCLLTCVGTTAETTKVVTNVPSVIRVAEPLAKVTVIWNDGAQAATIYEDDVIVARIQPGQSQKLAISGQLRLQAKTDADTTSLRVVTIRRCLCGDEFSPYDSGVVTPTGPDLI